MTNRGGRIIWALEELEQSYELVDLQLFKGEQRQPQFLNLNPHGKVPTLVIRNSTEDEPEVISESLAILYTLADRHQSLLPKEAQARAQCHQWLAYVATEMEPPLWTQAKHSFVYPEKRRIPEIFPSCLFEFQRVLKHIEQTMSDDRLYILGDEFTLADIYVGQTLMWSKSRSFGDMGEITKSYINRLKARPAWQRAIGTLKSNN